MKNYKKTKYLECGSIGLKMSKVIYDNRSGCYVVCKEKLCNIDSAFTLLKQYFGDGKVVLVAFDEKLREDVPNANFGNDTIKHYKSGNQEYDILPKKIKNERI